ncbi:CENP-B protein, partial [Ramaria rubella]
EDVIESKGIPPKNIYNEDEKGVQLGGGRKGLGMQFIFPRGMKKKVFKWANTLQLVTVLEAVSTDGMAVLVLLVLPGSKEPNEWWADTPEGRGSVVCTLNGWTDNEVYLGWFKKIFLPYATSWNMSGKPILLITDGHKSYKMCELMETAFEKDVLLFCLPPHTTDRLQPLDISVSGPLQKNWARHSQE